MKNLCFTCGKKVVHLARNGGKLFCNRICFGKSRRKWKTKAQKVAEKRAYDMAYREKNFALIKAKKHEYFKRTYDPVKAAKKRKKTMARHVEYCRQPQYKSYKRKYDLAYRSKKQFGRFWESAILVLDIQKEIERRMTKYEIYSTNGTLNKALKRRREYEQIFVCN